MEEEAVGVIRKRVKGKRQKARGKRAGIITFLILCVGLFIKSAMAEDIFSIYNYQYNLEPGITIKKPIISYEQNISTSTNLRVSFTRDEVDMEKPGVDSVSGASKLASGTSEVWDDIRNEFALSLTQSIGAYKLEGGYYHSRETDYLSQTPSLSVSRDFFNRNITLKFGYSHSFDQTFGHYMSESKDKGTDNFGVSLTQVFTPTTVGQVGYTYSNVSGFMPSGNRKVSITGSSAPSDEYMPDSRKREGTGIRIAQYLPIKGSVHLSYRWYRDTWSIGSDTISAQYFQYLFQNLIARLEYRLHQQRGAFFYQDTYSGAERFLTSTNIYAPFDSKLAGVKLSYHKGGKAQWKFSCLYERYTQSIGLEGDIYMANIGFLF